MDEEKDVPSGRDGTQAPPPPRLFPDPLAGLVTGELPYRREPPTPVVPPPAPPPAQPDPVFVPPVRRTQARRSAPRPTQVTGQPHVTGQPVVHAPHAPLARRQAPTGPGPHLANPSAAPSPQASGPQPPRKGKGGLIGCLVALAVLGGLLFNVVREIIEAVGDLLR